MSTDVPAITSDSSAPPVALPPLPSDVPTLQAMIVELLDALKKSQHEREGLQQRLDQLLRRLYGPKAERFDPHQPWLLSGLANADDANGETLAATVAADNHKAAEPAKPKRPGHGRKKTCLPTCRDGGLSRRCPKRNACARAAAKSCQKFGEEISEQLDYQPASLFVWQHVRFKYACVKCHDHVAVAPATPQVIDKGLPGPGLLAQITASKYADHLPLHRLERILGRHGIELCRSTMCGWMAQVAQTFPPRWSISWPTWCVSRG